MSVIVNNRVSEFLTFAKFQISHHFHQSEYTNIATQYIILM